MILRTRVWVFGLCLITLIAVSCSGAGPADSDEAAMPTDQRVDPIDELTATLEGMGVRASTPPAPEPMIDTIPDVVYLGDPPLTPEDLVLDVHSEVALLRDHVHQLERSLNFYMDTVVSDLREENAYLRDELARIYAAIPLEDRMRPVVPRPGSGVLNNVQDVAADPNYIARMNDARPELSVPLELAVAKEWGRTPGEAAEIGGDVGSLKGIIGSVAPGADDDTLLQFARELRDQYAENTNINIVIFDSEVAASTYADRNAKSTTRHILTIARHAQTGLDEIYIHRNGVVVHTERF